MDKNYNMYIVWFSIEDRYAANQLQIHLNFSIQLQQNHFPGLHHLAGHTLSTAQTLPHASVDQRLQILLRDLSSLNKYMKHGLKH